MPRVTNFHISPEEEELFYKSCVFNRNYFGDKVDKKDIVFRKRNYESLSKQSTFPDAAEAWNLMSEAQQQEWSDAGQWSGQSGWDLFAQDMSYRISHSIEGRGEASIYHQYFVGKISIQDPASKIRIKQNVSIGTARQFDFSINYKTNLVQTTTTHWAILFLYFEFEEWDGWYLYEEDLPFWDNDRWEYMSDYYDFGLDNIRNMYIEIDIFNMRGELYFDGLSLIANDVNIANDWQCDNIHSAWTAVDVPSGATYESVYSRNSFYNYSY